MKTVIASYFVLLIFQLHTSNVSAQFCQDIADWKDKDNQGCEWYDTITGADDYYYYTDEQGVSRCEVYGNCCYANGHTAVTACCSCGGGSDFDQKCSNVQVNGQPWIDSDGEGCNVYDPANSDVGEDDVYYDDGDTYCSYFGDGYANAGYTAQQACCVCGGGVRNAGPSTTPAPTIAITAPPSYFEKDPITSSPSFSPKTSFPTKAPTTNAPISFVTASPSFFTLQDDDDIDDSNYDDEGSSDDDCSSFSISSKSRSHSSSSSSSGSSSGSSSSSKSKKKCKHSRKQSHEKDNPQKSTKSSKSKYSSRSSRSGSRKVLMF